MDHDHSPRRDSSPRNHKERSYSRSPSRSRGRDRERRRDDRDRDYGSRDRRDRSVIPESYELWFQAGSFSRRRHTGTRDNPKPSNCLGVFGLSVYTTEDEIYHIFSKYGAVARVQVVIDAKTGRSRGFAFVYFEDTDEAKVAKQQCTGMKINDKTIRVDFSITERAHTPTPGIYMGKPTYKYDKYKSRGRRDRDDDYYGSSRSRRSPSPYHSRSRRRYRSRSYSPRRF
ncbi:transformer-2 protein homolog alpha isoform X2 [Dendroctonus ponderosae]|uniref:transformer-2 protein homolog alpha isoform X2 n=1 Tax=Dendroctonus ponderosae TaxID=77166 RepID=UPI002035CC81|nr:transformer-2 protein homolog alpha isoform X2 [Dendroctonus ponderosae]